ncbi:sensor histidine kinase [Leptospira sp. GIMC2001]|uniref:sensor histidine kinase n=1 Tax=Leptospira sp. GIMC2001 TaxID=1513297 RepID=UPI00234ACFD0|nr:PAS domain S-box protein [Leptospira sp. GIMC2001]WCL48157.1 PAS domain S-box protein [Leptospira sp. GIMC2001]
MTPKKSNPVLLVGIPALVEEAIAPQLVDLGLETLSIPETSDNLDLVPKSQEDNINLIVLDLDHASSNITQEIFDRYSNSNGSIPIILIGSEHEHSKKVKSPSDLFYAYLPANTPPRFILENIKSAIQYVQDNRAIINKSNYFDQITQDLTEIFWIEDLKTNRINYITPSFSKLFKISEEEIYKNPQAFMDRVIPEDRPQLIENYKNLIENKIFIETQYRISLPDSILSIRIKMNPVVDENGNCIRIIGYANDVTESNRIESELIYQAEISKLQIESMPIACLFLDNDFTIMEWNPAAEKMFGYSKSEIIGRSAIGTILDPREKSILMKIRKRFSAGRIDEFNRQNWNLTKDGRKILCEWKNAGIKNSQGVLLGAICMAQDITERTEQENRIKSLLVEKEILLKEVHHRVKNNMTTIASLLNLQAQAASDTQLSDALQDATNRVTSMMIIYEKLFGSKNFKTTGLQGYLESLISEITKIKNSHSISIIQEIENIFLETFQLFPIGIIVNELITNCLKHGFQGRDSGVVQIVGKKLPNNLYQIRISDDGIGIHAKKEDGSKKTGFGLMLIQILTEQLTATLDEQSNEKGTITTVIFPIPQQN